MYFIFSQAVLCLSVIECIYLPLPSFLAFSPCHSTLQVRSLFVIPFLPFLTGFCCQLGRNLSFFDAICHAFESNNHGADLFYLFIIIIIICPFFLRSFVLLFFQFLYTYIFVLFCFFWKMVKFVAFGYCLVLLLLLLFVIICYCCCYYYCCDWRPVDEAIFPNKYKHRP